MSVGLIDEYNRSVCVKSVYCYAEITDDFGVFSVKQKFCNDTDSVIDASYVFPISNCEIIVDFKLYIGNEVVISHLVQKRDEDSFEGFSFNSTPTDKSSFKVHIGKMAPGRTVETELKYIKNIESSVGYCKAVIPTVIMPNFTVDKKQYSFDSFSTAPSYELALDFTYHGAGITDAVCKTHRLRIDTNTSCVKASILENCSSNYDIIIEIKKTPSVRPVVYKYNNIIYTSVYPEIDIYNRQGKKYLFMVNITDKHKDEIKNAIIACLKALGADDLFNIIMLSRQNSVFSDKFLKADDDAVKNAAHWFDSYELGDSVELFSSVISSYKNNTNTVAMVFTDVKMSQNRDIISYIQNHKSNTYYPFEIDSSDDKGFLKALAESSGGKYHHIPAEKRADVEIINAFNIIAAPYIRDTAVSFDDIVSSVATTGAKRIHYGDKVGIIAEVYDHMPQNLYIDGKLSGKSISYCVPLTNIIDGGSSLRYLYAKTLIDNLSQKAADCSGYNEERLLTERIIDISSKYSIYNKYMDMLLMNYKGKFYDCVSIIRPKALPFDWYVDALNSTGTRGLPDDTDTEFIKIIKKQKANGSFVPSFSKSKENIAIFTAEVLSKICSEYHNPQLFLWQLRKSVLYLMDFINNNDTAKIPGEVLKGLKDWYAILGSNDEISQKVNALTYMYR